MGQLVARCPKWLIGHLPSWSLCHRIHDPLSFSMSLCWLLKYSGLGKKASLTGSVSHGQGSKAVHYGSASPQRNLLVGWGGVLYWRCVSGGDMSKWTVLTFSNGLIFRFLFAPMFCWETSPLNSRIPIKVGVVVKFNVLFEDDSYRREKERKKKTDILLMSIFGFIFW